MTDNSQPAPTVQEPPADVVPVDPVGWEKRARDAQAAFTRKSQEFAEYRATHPDVEPDDDAEDDDSDRPAAASRFRAAESRRPRVPESESDLRPAESVHGPEAVEVYGRLANLLDRATTPADKLTVLELYREMRSEKASSARRPEPPAERRSTRDEAVTPRVEINRPDTPADYQTDQTAPELYAGGQRGGVRGFVLAKLEARRNPR